MCDFLNKANMLYLVFFTIPRFSPLSLSRSFSKLQNFRSGKLFLSLLSISKNSRIEILGDLSVLEMEKAVVSACRSLNSDLNGFRSADILAHFFFKIAILHIFYNYLSYFLAFDHQVID
jgi:hypothetical protein